MVVDSSGEQDPTNEPCVKENVEQDEHVNPVEPSAQVKKVELVVIVEPITNVETILAILGQHLRLQTKRPTKSSLTLHENCNEIKSGKR